MSAANGRQALLVVDMQNGFLHENGSLSRLAGRPTTPLRSASPACISLIQQARHSHTPIVYTRHGYRPDGTDLGLLAARRGLALDSSCLRAGTWDNEIIDELQPAPHDIVVDKNRYDAFASSDLPQVLDSLSVGSLTVCGVMTGLCVLMTGCAAAMRDRHVTLASNAVADIEIDRHRHALATFARDFGAVG